MISSQILAANKVRKLEYRIRRSKIKRGRGPRRRTTLVLNFLTIIKAKIHFVAPIARSFHFLYLEVFSRYRRNEFDQAVVKKR